jgi:hypothetical protein
VNHSLVATAWWDQGLRIVTRHAIRYVAVLAVLAGLTRWAMWRRGRRPDAAASPLTNTAPLGIQLRLWVRYGLAGLILGATWVWHENQSPWIHAIRVAIVLLFVGPIIRWVQRRYAARAGRHLPGGMRIRGWMVAKLVLVVLAIGLELLLRQSLSHNAAAEITALCLGVAVAVCGPLLHRRLTGGWRRPQPLPPVERQQ